MPDDNDNASPSPTPPSPPPPSAPGPGGGKRGPVVQAVFASLPIIGIVLVAAIFIIIISSIFWVYLSKDVETTHTLLHELSDITVARGLITFLIAITTVGIALILVIYVVSTYDVAVKDHYLLGKEVLTSLIGILGTIVGFYFGQSTPPATGSGGVPIIVSNMALTPASPQKSSTTTLTAKIGGGQKPYNYIVVSSPKDVIAPIQGQSSDGAVSEKLQVSGSYDSTKPLDIQLLPTDAAQSSALKPGVLHVAPADGSAH
jgi:hypothetical protein